MLKLTQLIRRNAGGLTPGTCVPLCTPLLCGLPSECHRRPTSPMNLARCPLGRQQSDREPQIRRGKACFELPLCPELALILRPFAHTEAWPAPQGCFENSRSCLGRHHAKCDPPHRSGDTHFTSQNPNPGFLDLFPRDLCQLCSKRGSSTGVPIYRGKDEP